MDCKSKKKRCGFLNPLRRSADIKEVEIETYFVKNYLDLWFGYQEEPTPLFKKDGDMYFLGNVIYKLNNHYSLTNDERQYLSERQKYTGIEETNFENSLFEFCYRKKPGRIESYDGKSLEFIGEEPIKAIHGNDNCCFVLMVRMKTSDNHYIPMPHNKANEERWLCYTYESKLSRRATKADLTFKESGIYTKPKFWKKTI